MKHLPLLAILMFGLCLSTFAQEKLIEESKDKLFKSKNKKEANEGKKEEKKLEKVLDDIDANEKEKTVETIEVVETQTTMSRGENNALYIEIKDANTKDVEKHWKKYLKSEYAGKRTETDRSDEMVTENASIAGLGSNVTVYAKANSLSNDAVGFTAFFENSEGFVTSENESAYKVVKGLMYDFGIEERKYAVNEQLEDAEKDQKRLEKDLSSLETKNKNLHDDIEMYRKKIKQAEEDIVKNNEDQETKKVEIEAQKGVVGKILDLFNTIK